MSASDMDARPASGGGRPETDAAESSSSDEERLETPRRTWSEFRTSRGYDPAGTAEYRDAATGMLVGGLVRALRRLAGFSQRDLAKGARMTQPAVARIERGGVVPGIVALTRIAESAGRRLVLGFVDEAQPSGTPMLAVMSPSEPGTSPAVLEIVSQEELFSPLRVDLDHDGRLIVRAELPGIDPDKDLQVQFGDGILTIRAKRDSGFSRSVRLPEGVDEADLSSTYTPDGVLEVSIPVPGA